MHQEARHEGDYEKAITEHFFPYWDEETKRVWHEGLAVFSARRGGRPDADAGDHSSLCHLLVDMGLARRFSLRGDIADLFRKLDARTTARSLCWGADYFIATEAVARELIRDLARMQFGGTA